METTKKRWFRPVLIIIGRGRPEEQVLKTCKTGHGFAPGPQGICGLASGDSPCRTNVKS